MYSYNLELGSTQKRHGVICAIAALENIFDTYGYHVLDKVLRILVSTWEGEIYSLTGNMLNAVRCCENHGFKAPVDRMGIPAEFHDRI